MGSTRHGDAGNDWRNEPQDRVLSLTYKEQQTSSQPEATKGLEESWRTKDPLQLAQIKDLLEKHGPCPERLR
jgi:hypothetical protein